MNENTTNNAIVLNQDSTAEEYAKILRGRYITGITLTNMDCDGYALAATLTLDGPLTPHLTSEDWWDKDYGEENPALQQYLAEIGTNLTRLNANPKQIGNLWDGTDTDSKYVYFPIYDFNRNIPDTATSLQYTVSNLADLLRRTTTDNDENE